MPPILNNQLTSSEAFVYHYTKLHTALKFILPKRELRMNPLAEVNDPRENKHWDMEPLLALDSTRSYTDYDNWSRVISDQLKQHSKVLCCSADRPGAEGKLSPESLLDRGFAKPTMWQHYAQSHHGVCLVFDRLVLGAALSKQLSADMLHCGRVQYSDDGIVRSPGADAFSPSFVGVQSHAQLSDLIRQHGVRWRETLFFAKLIDWSNENEFRWVYSDDRPGHRDVSFGDALLAIVVGEASSFAQRWFTPYCVKYSAELATLSWRNGFPVVQHWDQPHISERGSPSGNYWQARVLKRAPALLFSGAVRVVRKFDRFYWGP